MAVGLIIGLTGITGTYLVRRMLKEQTFTKIYGLALQEDMPTFLPKDNRLQYISCDLTDETKCRDCLSRLTDVTHCFYVAWTMGGSRQEENDINGRMFKNLLNGVIQHMKNLEHIVLQTGFNYYGAHLGKNIRVPITEDHQRAEETHFYHIQEDFLREKGQNVKWTYNVVRPHSIIGFSGPYGQMNLAQSIAVYAILCKEKGLDFTFPGEQKCLDSKFDITDANLLVDFHLWLAVHRNDQKVKNKVFNCVNKDGQFFQYRNLWTKIGDYFGLQTKGGVVQTRRLEQEMKGRSKDWTDIVNKNNLVKLDIDQVGTWGYLDKELSRTYDVYGSMKLARDAGYTKEIDYLQSFIDCFDLLQQERIITRVEGVQRGKVTTTGKVQEGVREQKEAQAAQ